MKIRWVVDTAFTAALLGMLSLSLFSQTQFPELYDPQREYAGQQLWDIVDIPEENVDVGLWALIIARDYDPSVDIYKHLDELDKMAREIHRMAAGRNQDIVKFLMTRMFLYEPGVWNDHTPFAYDLDDPLGEKLENQLLSTYLTTRKGNCVSMPTLFMALMERVDPNIPFRGVSAPIHLFCRFYDRQTGDIWNVEAANGGNPARNQWYIEKMGVQQVSIDSGAYLRDLTKKEYIGELLYPLIARCRQERDYAQGLKYTELTLQLNPRSILGLVHKGAILSWLNYEIVEQAKTENRALTETEYQQLNLNAEESQACIERAKRLGWQPETPEDRAQYLEAIQAEKLRKSDVSTHKSKD